jgi:endonuclease/exonuclease/phosphatase family metal-dependent hydrolase
MTIRGSSLVLMVSLGISLGMVGCVIPSDDFDDDSTDQSDTLGESMQQATVPARGTATTLDIASWNIEWFGDTGNGPTNEALQLSNARDVIGGTDFDIWGLAEIVSTTQFNSLVNQLSGYAGFLANNSFVTNGAAFYSDFNNLEQKVGFVYKTSVVTPLSAAVILTRNDTDFAGRPPLEVRIRISLNGRTEDAAVIVMHPKCCADSSSYQRRVNASNALKAYLDATFPTQKVWVVGDWNDDVDTSIFSGNASPYRNFVTDTARYRVQTKALSDTGIASTVGFPDMIDHHMNTNEAAATFVANSVQVYRVDSFVPSYGSTTSDHFPVLSRYTFAGGGTPPPPPTTGANIVLNEICANEPGSNTAGEFVEIVNIGSASASLGGWTLSDSTSTRHTFASSTTLAPGKAIVIFGGASAIPGGLPATLAASTGSLGLGNGGDTVTLRSNTSAVISSFTYTSALSGQDGVSMNRNPDGGSTASFVLHTALGAAPSSPATRASGAAW